MSSVSRSANPEAPKHFEVNDLITVVTGEGSGNSFMAADFSGQWGYRLSKKEDKGVNILINNAGVFTEQKASEQYASNNVNFNDPVSVSKWMTCDGTEVWHTSYAGNVVCHHFFTAALLPLLDKGRYATPGQSSSIINIASTAGVTKTSSKGQFAYSSPKAAFFQLTHEWAHTFVPLRIRVNCIAPGLFSTELTTGGSNENQKSDLGAVFLLASSIDGSSE